MNVIIHYDYWKVAHHHLLLISLSLSLSQEILQQLMEQGVKFSQKDYTNALTLLAQSSLKYPEEKLKREIKQLDTLFAQDAV